MKWDRRQNFVSKRVHNSSHKILRENESIVVWRTIGRNIQSALHAGVENSLIFANSGFPVSLGRKRSLWRVVELSLNRVDIFRWRVESRNSPGNKDGSDRPLAWYIRLTWQGFTTKSREIDWVLRGSNRIETLLSEMGGKTHGVEKNDWYLWYFR